MFGLSALEAKLIAIAAVLAIVLAILVAFGVHERHAGAAKCELDDAKVAAIQTAAARAQEARDAQRVKEAEDDYQNEVAANTQLRASLPTDHVVCVAPRPQRVPAAPNVQKAQPSGAGSLPPARAPDTFDPGPQLDTLLDEADDVLASCRELNNAVPH
jgi:hypothetical protein